MRFSSVLAFLWSSGTALARAGGGGGFHGGGHGSGGGHLSSGGHLSGSGGGGDGGFVFDLLAVVLNLTLRRPVVGLPLDLAILALAVWIWRGRQARRRSTVWQGAPDADPSAPSRRALAEASLVALKERDPGFDEAKLQRRIAEAFVRIQAEWTERHLRQVTHLTTDGVRERFQLLLDLERDRGIANVTCDVQVAAVAFVEAASDQFYDSLTVRIDAAAADFHVRAGTTQIVYGSRTPAPFAEYWTLLRRPDARTGAGPGLMEGHCPSCGAPLQLTDKGACAYCQAVVHSGAFDWVLAGIQQTSVADGHHRAVSGLRDLTAKDPGFCVAYAEDRTALIFWRLRAAEARGTPGPLAKFATPAFVKAHGLDVADGTFVCDAAVGSVELVAAVPGQAAGEPDRLHVRVKWSGREVQAKLPTFLPPRYEDCHLFDEDFVLERAGGATTPTDQGLRSAHCPACGAPETADAGTRCASCGADLASGALDWVLADVRVFEGIPARTAARAETSPADDRRVRLPEAEDVVAACAAALAGGKNGVGGREAQLLQHFAMRRGLAPARLAVLLRAVGQGKLPAVRFAGGAQRRQFLQSLLQQCVVEGELQPEEEALFRTLAARLAPLGFDADAAVRAARAATSAATSVPRPAPATSATSA